MKHKQRGLTGIETAVVIVVVGTTLLNIASRGANIKAAEVNQPPAQVTSSSVYGGLPVTTSGLPVTSGATPK